MLKPKHLFSLIFILLIANVTLGQKIKWGELQKTTSKNYSPNFIGDDVHNIYSLDVITEYLSWGILKIPFNVSILRAYSKTNFKMVFEKKLKDFSSIGVSGFYHAKMINKNLYLLGFGQSQNHKTIKQIAVKIDPQNESLISKDTFHLFDAMKYDNFNINTFDQNLTNELINAKYESSGGGAHAYDYKGSNSLNDDNFLGIKSTPDNSKILFLGRFIKKSGKKTLTVKLVDNNFKLIQEYSGDTEIPFDFDNIIIDNEGSIYYLEGLEKLVSLEANRNYEKWEESISIESLPPGSTITNVNFTLDKEGNIILFGFYNKISKKSYPFKTLYKGDLKGYFYLKMDYLTKEILISKTSSFSKEHLNKIEAAVASESDEKEDILGKVFNKIKLVPLNDGSLMVTAETVKTMEGRTEYNDFIVLKIDDFGDLKQFHFLPKKQIVLYNSSILFLLLNSGFKNSNYFGTTSFTDNKKYYVLFNNHVKNSSVSKKNKSLHNIKSAKANLYEYDLKSNEIELKEVENGIKKNSPIIPKFFYQSKINNSFYIFGKKGKLFCLGELILE